jgi:hypothetical protein
MVIAARRKEGCPFLEALGHLETENVSVEGDRPHDIGNLQMEVPDPDSSIDWENWFHMSL